jgi:hypothetical protein
MPGYRGEQLVSQTRTRKGDRPVVAIAAGSFLPMLPVRPRLREITHYFLAQWPVIRLPRLEDRRLGFEPFC